jgi:glycosyltransferase involved in cell wall biosynthesis
MQSIIYKKGNFLGKVFGVFRGYLNRIKYLFKLKNYDVVYVFLWVTPFGIPIFEKLYTSFSKAIIYDIDDAIFLSNASEYNSFIGKLKGKTKPFTMMKNAKHIITCTPFLDEIARKYNQNTTDISSTINTETYQVVNQYNNDHQIVLGWSGSHSTAKYLYLLKDVLLKLKETHPFKLMVMGDASFHIDGLDIEAKEWREEIEISTIQQFDIGLYPLPNEKWVLGKSGLKALQYMAVGLPVVATAIGANDRVISDKKTGFLVSNEDQWLQALIQLIENPALRKSFGEEGRLKVENEYSVKANAPKYLAILENAIERK